MQHQILEAHDAAAAERVASFFNEVWSGAEVAPFDLMLAAQHAGGYLHYTESDGVISAASFGFLGSRSGASILHSHVTASKIAGLGYSLKQHQFEWARLRGITGVTWTFDPLVRRNCVFNFVKLGAIGVEYLPNFYGAMTDAINFGDESDRLLAYVDLGQRQTSPTPATDFENTALVDRHGRPERVGFDSSQPFWIELPSDIETLRRTNLGSALEWRHRVRELLLPAFAEGMWVTRMNDSRTAFQVANPTAHR